MDLVERYLQATDLHGLSVNLYYGLLRDEKDHMSEKKRKSSQELPVVPIVSSEHLTSPDSWQLSEFEYGLIIANNAFS